MSPTATAVGVARDAVSAWLGGRVVGGMVVGERWQRGDGLLDGRGDRCRHGRRRRDRDGLRRQGRRGGPGRGGAVLVGDDVLRFVPGDQHHCDRQGRHRRDARQRTPSGADATSGPSVDHGPRGLRDPGRRRPDRRRRQRSATRAMGRPAGRPCRRRWAPATWSSRDVLGRAAERAVHPGVDPSTIGELDADAAESTIDVVLVHAEQRSGVQRCQARTQADQTHPTVRRREPTSVTWSSDSGRPRRPHSAPMPVASRSSGSRSSALAPSGSATRPG